MVVRLHMTSLIAVAVALAAARFADAAPVTFKTTDDGATAFRVVTQVKATGRPMLPAGNGKVTPHTMTAGADFTFTERRLPSGGRDAMSLRAVRDFETAMMSSEVAPEGEAAANVPKAETRFLLPKHLQLIVAEGRSTGVTSYCPRYPMSREAIDLLELPGDPLALAGLLAPRPVEVEETWSPPEWAGQMLAAIDAIESSTLNCKLVSATDSVATIAVSGMVKGQRDGTNCEVTISGSMTYDRTKDAISSARLKYAVKSTIGAVSPGLDLTMDVQTQRQALDSPGRLDDKLIAAIPIATPETVYDLVYDAAPWGIRLRHSRDWYFFKDSLENEPRVAIFRLMQKGSIIAQCNMSPLANASPGQHVSLDQFEKDIRASLGPKLKNIRAKEPLGVDGGTKVFRVIADGEHTIVTPKEKFTIPTTWVYYLCAAPSGRQASFVFAVESKLVEQMGTQDEVLVRSLQFFDQRSAKTP